jgi:hypothetical protein
MPVEEKTNHDIQVAGDVATKDEPITIAFLVDWPTSQEDLFASLLYIERAIEVAKNTWFIGNTRLIVADRGRGRVDHASPEALAALVPLAAQIDIVSCSRDPAGSAFNQMSMRTGEEFFFLTKAGVVISPTSLETFLEVAKTCKSSLVCGRRLPVDIDREPLAGSHPDLGCCSLIRAASFHSLSGFDCENFSEEFFAIDFCGDVPANVEIGGAALLALSR